MKVFFSYFLLDFINIYLNIKDLGKITYIYVVHIKEEPAYAYPKKTKQTFSHVLYTHFKLQIYFLATFTSRAIRTVNARKIIL